MKISIKHFFSKCDQIHWKIHVLCTEADISEFNFKGPFLWHAIHLTIQFSEPKISIHLSIHLLIMSVLNFVGHVGLVPSYLRGSKIFSRVYFVGSKIFLAGFVGPKFFLMGILWVQSFFTWTFCGLLVNI